MALPVDGHLIILHRFEQRRLGLCRGAVDFVGQYNIREQWTGAKTEFIGFRVKDIDACDVRRHQVGGELDA